MKNAAVFLFVLVGIVEPSNAAVVFFLNPNNSTVIQGSTATFSVFVRSTLAGGEQVDALEANVITTAGNFTAGNTFLLNNGAVDLSTPGQAFLSNFAGGGFNLTNANTLFANLSLSTVGVALGTYNISFDPGSLSANSPTLAGLPVVDGGPINFTVSVTAVPEPSSMLALVGIMVGGFALHRKRRVAKVLPVEAA